MTDRSNAARTEIRVEKLKEMLDFQQQAIVSRMLVKNAAGSVTLFAFDEGEGLSEHTAPFDALLIGVEGEAEVRVDAGGLQRLRRRWVGGAGLRDGCQQHQ